MTRLALSILLALVAAPAVAAEMVELSVSPSRIEITHHRHAHAIQVLGISADGYSVDLRDSATFATDNPRIATVEGGVVKPVASGSAKITVSAGGKTVVVPVSVKLPPEEPPISFRHEVMPTLTRAGCNAGACHGYSLGKNGFKLSLRGSDPEPDFFAIVKDSAGRRVNFQTPANSLLVAKARGETAHEGGMRFARGSLGDTIFNKWISQGAPGDLKDPAQVIRVTMVPDKLVLKPGEAHRIQLIAEYADGTKRDVTRLGVFAVNNDRFATVDDDGKVTAGVAGETAVLGRFERVFAATGVTVLKPVANFTPTPVPAHVIDKPVVEKLNRLKITPSEIAGDEEFLRRVYLDMIGLQPKPDEVRAFLADKDPKKREKIVDALFERPEFVDHWSLKWGDLLQNSRNAVSSPAMFQFREFIRSAVASNMLMDKFATKLLTAKGGITDDPASTYFAISKDTNETVERVTQVFCGVRMLCTRCHSHPMENWTQADYFGLASFFTQVTVRADSRPPNNRLISLNPNAGSATNPRTNRAQPARFLGGAEPTLEAGIDRRIAYAKWLTDPKNEFFARGIVNRYWSYFFHRGIIDPVDDIRSTNPPINPALLDALTADFVKSGFDTRHLMRRIVSSQTYQRTGVPNASNKRDELNFSHSISRRVPAEALLDSLVQATAIPEPFAGAPGGFRASQLPDGNIENVFLRLFGKPQRMDACECERDNGSNMLQALHFLKGKSILGRVRNPSARPALLIQKKLSDEELVKELYLWSLARFPNEKELELGLDFLKASEDRTAGAQDLMWALLNSKDFLLVR